MREIKFRAWTGEKIITEFLVARPQFCDPLKVMTERQFAMQTYGFKDYVLMQFTGKKGFNDRELYEGDIVFYEEATENGDERFYLVIIWIEEWSMFASVFIDEYLKYIDNGSESLDEGLFWTYTLERDVAYFHYAGNIYENPELLNR